MVFIVLQINTANTKKYLTNFYYYCYWLYLLFCSVNLWIWYKCLHSYYVRRFMRTHFSYWPSYIFFIISACNLLASNSRPLRVRSTRGSPNWPHQGSAQHIICIWHVAHTHTHIVRNTNTSRWCDIDLRNPMPTMTELIITCIMSLHNKPRIERQTHTHSHMPSLAFICSEPGQYKEPTVHVIVWHCVCACLFRCSVRGFARNPNPTKSGNAVMGFFSGVSHFQVFGDHLTGTD